MKFVLACLLLVAAAQAAEWSNVKARFLTRPDSGYRPLNGRIIGGNTATRHQFPYQVGIYLDGSGFCGGSLISNTVVLTAAHCADGTRTYDVHLAAQNINEPNEPNRQIVRSTNGRKHENYNPNTINNDIAIVTMSSAVSGTGISPVRLPSRDMASDTFVGDIARVSGWGRFSDNNPNISPELKYVDVTVISNAQCAAVYGSNINESKVCINTDGGTSGTCNGDSGGPLVIYESDGLPTEIGIVSFGSSAGCESGAPAAFTRVTSYLDWLEENAGVNIRP